MPSSSYTLLSRLNNYFDLWKISASQNNTEDKSSVDSVRGLTRTEHSQILPNYCLLEDCFNSIPNTIGLVIFSMNRITSFAI